MTVPDVHAVPAAPRRLAGIGDCLPDESELTRRIAELHARVHERNEPALGALLGALDEFVGQWDQRHGVVQLTRDAFEQALDEERRTRRHLVSVLELVSSMLAERATEASDGPTADTSAPEPRELFPAALPPEVRESPLVVLMFGPFSLFANGRLLDTSGNTKTYRVMRHLLARRRAVPRDVLIELFWPDADLDTGRRNLHQAVYVLRKALRIPGGHDSVISLDGDAYSINPTARLWNDIDEFDRELRDGRSAEAQGDSATAERHFAAAVALYRGEFLEDTPYEEWALAARDQYRVAFLEGANRLAQLQHERSDYASALTTTQQTLRLESCDETAHRLAMRLHAQMGEQSLVIRQFRTCVSSLAAAYDVTPSDETTALFEELRLADRSLNGR